MIFINVCLNRSCIFAFAKSLPRFLAIGLIVCVTILSNELWGQPVQGVSAVENSSDSDNKVKIEWLSENAVPIRSIDPGDDDFTDLMPFKSLLNGVRVVMLGEASHGDGAAFYAKTQLVRFLHEVMGFNVIAWEARFFAMEEINQALKSGQSVPMIDSIWVEYGVLKPIFQYSRDTYKTGRPLRHTGVDIRCNYPAAKWMGQYRERLMEFLYAEGFDPASPQDIQTINKLLLTFEKDVEYNPSEEESAKVQAAIRRVRVNLLKKAASVKNSREIEYFAKTLDNLAANEKHTVLSIGLSMPPKQILFRDRKMGENLIWLANEWYPEEKIIVWAANRHVARNLSSIEMNIPGRPSMQLPSELKEMGDFMYRELGKSVYSIAFISYQGPRTTSHQGIKRSVESVPGSIQSLWHHTGHSYGFLDFRSIPSGHWLYEPVLAHIDGNAIQRAIWPNVFDGLFFIDTMFPNTESGEVPEGVHTKKQ